MLISLEHRFVVLCPAKTASTSVEVALKPFSQISIPYTELGKHDDLSDVQWRYSWISDYIPWPNFKVVLCIRHPLARLESLFKAHTSEQFRGQPAFTGKLTPLEFVDKWLPIHGWQSAPQFAKCLNLAGRFVGDFLIRQEYLVDDLAALCDVLNLPFDELIIETHNMSPELADDNRLADTLELLAERYMVDALLWKEFAGRMLTSEDRRKIEEAIYKGF